MARTISQIYDALITEKNAQAQLSALQPAIDNSQTLLSNLTTLSKVAIWRLEAFITTVAIWLHEVEWDEFKLEIETIVANSIPGTARWFRDQSLAFQNGYQLTWINNKFQYATIDEAAKIVKRAAVVEVGGQVRIKVAKLVSGSPAPLSAGELTSFENYIKQIKFAGVNSAVISTAPDDLKLQYTVYYDALVPLNDVKTAVEAAIDGHVSNLEFNGDLILAKLTDAVQLAKGVVIPELTLAEAKYGGNPYAGIVTKYNANAGYLKIDPAFPLSTNITYIAYNV